VSELWIASGNDKKRRELQELVVGSGLQLALRLMSELDAPPVVEEDQPTFAGNAQKKAVALAMAVGAHALGDDSGLCVDALAGRPGVHSARYAGPEATDRQRIDKLLVELEGVPDSRRTAHFVCSLCLATPDGQVAASVAATCQGVILREPRGDGGFGYDPVFWFPPSGCSFAEMPRTEKHLVSHRGKALALLAEAMCQLPAFRPRTR
jgi:XTP/dITP diphosphohydrolase